MLIFYSYQVISLVLHDQRGNETAKPTNKGCYFLSILAGIKMEEATDLQTSEYYILDYWFSERMGNWVCL